MTFYESIMSVLESIKLGNGVDYYVRPVKVLLALVLMCVSALTMRSNVCGAVKDFVHM